MKSVWNALDIPDSYSPYFNFKNHINLEKYWKTFEINELGDRDIFFYQQRVKIILKYIQDSFKIDDLVNK